MTNTLLRDGFETRPISMQPFWQIAFQAPVEDVDRIFDAIIAVVPLVHGKTDCSAYRASSGQEYYRPMEGTPTGAEDDVRKRPGVDEVRFFLPRSTADLEAVVEAIYDVCSYYEPVISLTEVLRSTTKGLDDSKNPHRWWNKDGDWKTS